MKQYDFLLANPGYTTSYVDGRTRGTYLPAVHDYFDRGRRSEPLSGRFLTAPAFFDYQQYRKMNVRRIGLSSYAQVVQDYLTYGVKNQLPGRSSYADHTGFKLSGVAGKVYFTKGGRYCEEVIAAGSSSFAPTLPYAPSNLDFIGPCPTNGFLLGT